MCLRSPCLSFLCLSSMCLSSRVYVSYVQISYLLPSVCVWSIHVYMYGVSMCMLSSCLRCKWWAACALAAGLLVQVLWCRCSGAGPLVQVLWCICTCCKCSRCSSFRSTAQIKPCRKRYVWPHIIWNVYFKIDRQIDVMECPNTRARSAYLS